MVDNFFSCVESFILDSCKCHSDIHFIGIRSKKVEPQLGTEKEVVKGNCSLSENKFQIFVGEQRKDILYPGGETWT